MNSDQRYMFRCLELAVKGGNAVGTNPLVGCVIVHNERVIGEGYHIKYGDSHAEVNAVASVSEADRSLLPESTLYVNLEPCSHYGKTPPCCDMIIRERIKRVVVGMCDPFLEVNGRGIAKMRLNDIDVTVGILEEESIELNRHFIVFNNKKRPYITLKWAETSDGYIDSDRSCKEPPVWMTGEQCREIVHRLRSEHSAIMVGGNTVRRDNPSLTVRECQGGNPVRVSVERHGKIQDSAKLFNSEAPTIVFTSFSDRLNTDSVDFINTDFYDEGWLNNIIEELYRRGVKSLFVEGGKFMLQQFIDKGLYDDVKIFISPMKLVHLGGSGTNGIEAPIVKGGKFSEKYIGDIVLKEMRR